MQWLMMQQDEPEDYVIASGEQHSVREFVELAGKELGYSIGWAGEGLNEKGVDGETGKVLISVDPRYFRLTESRYADWRQYQSAPETWLETADNI